MSYWIIRHKYCGYVKPDGTDGAAYGTVDHSLEDSLGTVSGGKIAI